MNIFKNVCQDLKQNVLCKLNEELKSCNIVWKSNKLLLTISANDLYDCYISSVYEQEIETINNIIDKYSNILRIVIDCAHEYEYKQDNDLQTALNSVIDYKLDEVLGINILNLKNDKIILRYDIKMFF